MKIIRLILAVFALFFGAEAMGAPGRVTDLKAANVTSSSFALMWKVPSSAFSITNVDLRVSTNPITALNWNTRTRVDYVSDSGAIGTTQTVVIHGLPSGTTNYYAVKLRDSTGAYSMMSNLLKVWTSVGNTTHPVLAWDPSPDANVVGYGIWYGTNSGSYQTRIDVGNVTWCRVTIPVNGMTYYFVAFAYTIDGVESLPSNEVSYTPPSAPPSPGGQSP